MSGNYGADLIRGFLFFFFFFPPSVKAINVIIDFRASKGRGGCIYSLAHPSRQRGDNSFKSSAEPTEPLLGGLQWEAEAGRPGSQCRGWGLPSRPPALMNGLERGPGLFMAPTAGKAVFLNAFATIRWQAPGAASGDPEGRGTRGASPRVTPGLGTGEHPGCFPLLPLRVLPGDGGRKTNIQQ